MNSLKIRAVTFLKQLERYTKTDMLYLAKGGFWGGVSQVALVLMSFGFATAVAHLVPKETYGQYKYILSLVGILSIFTLTGLNTALIRSVSKGYEGTLQYAFWKNLRWCALFFLGAGLASAYYYIKGNNILGTSLLFVGTLWPFFNSSNLYASFLVAKKDFRRVTVYFDIISNIFPYLSLICAMFITDNPAWLVGVYIVSNTAGGLLLYRRVISIYKPDNKIDPEILGYSKHLSFMGILSGIAENIDQVLVFHYIGAAQLAVYNFAIAIPDQIKAPIKNLSNMIFPKFAEREDREIRQTMGHKIKLLLIASVFTAGIYILVAPYIFKIFFPTYTDSIVYSQLYSISLLYLVAIPVNTYLVAKKRIKEQYIINFSISIFQILILLISIIKWGLLGLILARVVIRYLSSLLSIGLYYKSSITET